MLDEIVVEVEGDRYLGHVWADPTVPSLGTRAILRWRFSRLGRFVAEFPALPSDTPENVRLRLVRTLERIRAHGGRSGHVH